MGLNFNQLIPNHHSMLAYVMFNFSCCFQSIPAVGCVCGFEGRSLRAAHRPATPRRCESPRSLRSAHSLAHSLTHSHARTHALAAAFRRRLPLPFALTHSLVCRRVVAFASAAMGRKKATSLKKDTKQLLDSQSDR